MTTRNWSSDMLLLVEGGVFHVVLSGTPVISERSIFRDTEVVRVFFEKNKIDKYSGLPKN